jgi:hypothetical protein
VWRLAGEFTEARRLGADRYSSKSSIKPHILGADGPPPCPQPTFDGLRNGGIPEE